MIDNQKPGIRSALVLAIAAAALSGCGSDGASSGGSGSVSSVDATSTSGTVISVNGGKGGKGVSSYGGEAGYVEAQSYGGDVKVLNEGAASTGFTVHSITPYFGTNPVTVSANTTVALYADCTVASAAAAGSLYLVTGDATLRKSDATAGCAAAETVTGLKVNSGITLKLPLNSGSYAYFRVSNDLQNQGIITPLDVSASQRGDLDIESSGGNYLGSGKLLTNGTQPGQSGGDIYVYGSYSLLNSGAMDASGAASSTGNGGNAGYIYLEGYYYTQNTGALTAAGGASTFASGVGGSADYVELYADQGAVMNSGALTATGGKGATAGDGGGIYVYAEDGALYNKGALKSFGGDATVGNAGDGGDIYFEAYSGEIRNSGAALANGGKATGAAGNGGDAGYIDVYSYDNYSDAAGNEYVPAGNITWSGRIASHGGDALATGTGSGGDGYEFYSYTSSSYLPFSNITLLGYSRVDAFGGTGASGGSANDFDLYSYYGYDSNSGDYLPGGNVTNQAAFKGNGGDALAVSDATNGYGGSGGYLDFETDDYYSYGTTTKALVKHTGSVLVSGGQNKDGGSTSYGRAGYVYVYGLNGISWSGAVTANGGKDVGTGTSSYGGYANNSQEWYAPKGKAAISGNLTLNGGAGAYRGGDGGEPYIYATSVAQSGTISVNGGNATATLAGSVGGHGGWVEFRAVNPASSSAAATASIKGGTGMTAGEEGGYWRFGPCTGAWCD